ncbi:unnamed protein product [Sphenostylis stenocarpa]|uniref:Uncharacterized protein n=1 Tax=Sphenostylis stenocarpa TaxID=92480 RepID=A0AA86S9T4_9FABA|nr:unnamed protein product [Sphenostylis stenocarpa]
MGSSSASGREVEQMVSELSSPAHPSRPLLLCQLLVSESILTTSLRDRQLEEHFPSAWPGVLHISREGSQ